MPTLQEIIGDYPSFLSDIMTRVSQAGFDLIDFSQLDHLCYRTVSLENYEQKKAELSQVARLLGEAPIAGRPIANFQLHEPIIHDHWRIDAIELPAPKSNSTYRAGLEHIELVLYDDIPTFLKKYAGRPFETHFTNCGINPSVKLQLGDYAVKFHLLSLPAVVYLEQHCVPIPSDSTPTS